MEEARAERERERVERERQTAAMTWQDHLAMATRIASSSYNSGDTTAHHAMIQTQLLFALVKQG